MKNIMDSKEYFEDLKGRSDGPSVPGANHLEGEDVVYAEDKLNGDFAGIFSKMIHQVSPPLMTSGGAVLDGCVLTIPDGRSFQAITYRGDLEGWRQQIELGAKAMGIVLGRIEGVKLVLNDGGRAELSECKAEFY